MAYCTVAEVESLMQVTFTATSRPTTDDASGIVDDVAAQIDGVAQASGYTVPITGATGIAHLRPYNRMGAACRCWHAGYLSDVAPDRVAYWCQEFKDFIARLRRGEEQIPGETPESDIDPAFGVVQMPPRDTYLTGSDESLEE